MSNAGQMTNEEKITYQWQIVAHTVGWIQSADNKAAVALATIGIVAGFLCTSAFELSRSQGFSNLITDLGWFTVIILLISVGALVISTACAFLCLTARTGVRTRFRKILEPTINRPSSTLIFFGKVATDSRKEYVATVQQANERQTLIDLAEQTHVLACIATEKYRWLNKMYVSLGIALISFLALALVTLF
jgi:hypothetical protein